MEKNYSLLFKDMKCTIFYPYGTKLMIVEMRGKSFPVKWKQTSLRVFPSRVEKKNSAQKRGTLDGNYARCDIAMLETARYTEAANFEGCKVTMQEEKKIIEKDVCCNVVDASVHDLCVFQNKSDDDVKTTFDSVFSFGHVVSVWSLKKQEGITQSSTKAECVSAAIDQKTWPMSFVR